MASLSFIKENPFQDHYNKQRAFETQQAGNESDLATKIAKAPFEVRNSKATTDFNESRAQVQGATAGNQIEQSNLELQSSQDTVKNGNFLKSIDLLHDGRIDEAQEYARRNNVEIPPQILHNARAQQAIKAFSDAAKERYPNRPNDQAIYIKNRLKAMMETFQQNGYDPAAAAADQPGDPTPPDQAFSLVKPSTPGAGGGGPFAGRTQTERMMNMLQTGDPRSPEYRAAYATLAKPQMSFDPNTGEAVLVNPDMSWARPPGDIEDNGGGVPAPGNPQRSNFGAPQGAPGPQSGANAPRVGTPSISTTPGRTGSPTYATYGANIQGAEKDLALANNLFFPQGSFDRGPAATGAVNVPWSKGREGRQAIRRAVEVILRLRTGAAAPDAEVDRYSDMYTPSVLDSDQSAQTKMQRLQQFFEDSKKLGMGGAGQAGRANDAGDTNAVADSNANGPDPLVRGAKPSQAAIDHLKSNPELAPYFDQKYGQGASQQFLGR